MFSRSFTYSLLAFTIAAMGACAPMTKAPIENAAQDKRKSPSSPLASADLIDASNSNRGKAHASPRMDAVQIDVTVTKLPAGVYAMHLHSAGKCDAPDFKTANAHLNPAGKMHGRDNPIGAHFGDLPNLTVKSGGPPATSITFEIPNLFIDGPNGLFDNDGTAIIIHAQPDDYRTDPSGNSGARIICGSFQRIIF